MREQKVPDGVKECVWGMCLAHIWGCVRVWPSGQCGSICTWLCAMCRLPPHVSTASEPSGPWVSGAPSESHGEAHTGHRVSLLFSHRRVWLFATPWTAARQASLSFAISQSLLKLMSIKLVMPSNHLVLHPFSSCLQSFPASESLLMNRVLTLGGQSTEASASASVLPINLQV